MMREVPIVLLAVIGSFAWQSAIAPNGECKANDANDTEYLIFWSGLPGASSPGNYEASIRNFAAKLGTTGDGKTRQLGFGNDIPFFTNNETKIASQIKANFDMARRTNVAVHFVVDDHIGWDKRPDLWNWYDPSKPGYNPNNRKNVEWYDSEWNGQQLRYITPDGCPSQSPHMCYNSPTILQRCTASSPKLSVPRSGKR